MYYFITSFWLKNKKNNLFNFICENFVKVCQSIPEFTIQIQNILDSLF